MAIPAVIRTWTWKERAKKDIPCLQRRGNIVKSTVVDAATMRFTLTLSVIRLISLSVYETTFCGVRLHVLCLADGEGDLMDVRMLMEGGNALYCKFKLVYVEVEGGKESSEFRVLCIQDSVYANLSISVAVNDCNSLTICHAMHAMLSSHVTLVTCSFLSIDCL